MIVNGNKCVVCIGDSITRAQISVDYVEMLRRRFADSQVTFVNAGVNFDTSFSLLNRLDDVIDYNPDMVTVLVGTNDVNATLSVNYLPLFERMTAYLRTNNISPATLYRPGNFLPSTASMQYFLLRRDLDTISARRGLHLTADTIHLNSRGASMVT